MSTKIKGAGGDVTLDVGDDLYKLLYRFQNGDYKNQGLIIGINADSRYLFLQYGSGVALTREEAKQAGDEFRRVVASKGYTEGVLAALASLEKTLTSKGVMGAQNPLGQLLPWIIGGIVVIVVAGGGWLLYVRRKKAQQSPAPEEEST
ncbi:hypothetical protein [Thermosporothrix hazakensis]|uniref:hypothetical protein n=1 Tax=Thermosporothrix hazakensis TaxID=644383 RepID=UPI001B87680A|nr:hypothetical protein [Thermosporothrix hazakensis]